MTPTALDALRRAPDVEAPELTAVDAADRLVLDEAAPLLADSAPGEVAVLGERYGALALGAVLHGARRVRVHADRLSGELAVTRNASALEVEVELGELGPEVLAGARLVLIALPRSLAALDDLAVAAARHASGDVRVVAGGRLKHMTLAMNDVLARSFSDVHASRARQKARVLHASTPLPREEPAARVGHADGLVVCAYGGVFAGASLDRGTRLLLGHLPRARPDAQVVIDLGCGTGLLACAVRRDRPDARVIATDESASAVRSARATAAANGLDVEVLRDLGLATQPDASADLVLLNPPFHSGATMTERAAHPLFREAARVLRPGGELWCVWNSHLGHRAALQRTVGPTRQIDRNRSFTVTASTRR